MKKQLDVSSIGNELHQSSVFFRPKKEPEPPSQPEPEKPNVYKSTNQQTNKSTSGQVDKSTNPLTDKSTNQQVNKSTKRFTTYLTDESNKAMKRLALETDKKDYELFQEAVDKYLKKRGT